jgi:hypothetical protein
MNRAFASLKRFIHLEESKHESDKPALSLAIDTVTLMGEA